MHQAFYPEVSSFVEYLQFEKRYSQHTVTSYRTDLDQFFSFLEKNYDSPALPLISSGIIRSWLADMRNAGITAKSLNRKISCLKSFFKYQIKVGGLTQNPVATIISPKNASRLPTFVSEDDMETLENRIEFADTWKGKTDKILLSLFYATGMRLSELISLKESHLDVSNRQIKVLGKGNKERIIPVSKNLVNQLENYIEDKRQQFKEAGFPNLLLNEKAKPLYPKYIYNVVKANLSMVTTLQKKSPHILRHTFATHLTNHGADLNAIKELLGHSSLAATQIYTHNTIEKLKEIHKKAHPKA